MNFDDKISKIPKGYSEVEYKNKKYGSTRTDFNNGRSTKIYVEELGGNDVISFNYYRMHNGHKLKACEMPKEKVLSFLSTI